MEEIVHGTMTRGTTMADSPVRATVQLLLLVRVMTADQIRDMIRGTRLALHHHRIMDKDEEVLRLGLMGDRL